MAEAQPVSVPETIASTVDADRAARVQGLINAILASPNAASIQAALSDPEVNAAALSDTGVSVLVATLTGAGNAELAKQAKDLAPTADERKQILDQVAPAPAVGAAPVVVAGADNGTAVAVATAPVAETGATVVAAGAASEVTPQGNQAVAGGVAANVAEMPSILQPKPLPGGSVAVAPRGGVISKA